MRLSDNIGCPALRNCHQIAAQNIRENEPNDISFNENIEGEITDKDLVQALKKKRLVSKETEQVGEGEISEITHEENDQHA